MVLLRHCVGMRCSPSIFQFRASTQPLRCGRLIVWILLVWKHVMKYSLQPGDFPCFKLVFFLKAFDEFVEFRVVNIPWIGAGPVHLRDAAQPDGLLAFNVEYAPPVLPKCPPQAAPGVVPGMRGDTGMNPGEFITELCREEVPPGARPLPEFDERGPGGHCGSQQHLIPCRGESRRHKTHWVEQQQGPKSQQQDHRPHAQMDGKTNPPEKFSQ